MRFEIDHRTVYTYTKRVFLEPLEIRLRPKTDINQKLIDYQMDINPTPSGQTEINDLDGNVTALLWFSDLQDKLEIHTQSRVETYLENPFEFLITDPGCQTIPVRYPHNLEPQLQAYMGQMENPMNQVQALVQEVREQSTDECLPFLVLLCEEIHRKLKIVIRNEGDPHTPEETLTKGEGACRDLAVLFMEACRMVGMATRFVSGYYEVSSDQPGEYLHAWAEVYLPGAGWRGFDPTNGFAVADRHVVVATGANPALAAPTSGSFRGTGVESEMTFELKFEGVEEK